MHGGGIRQIPIFPELLPHLPRCSDLAEPETEYVITRYRDPRQNLRTMLERIIRRPGLEPWPKLFQDLCSTRETELTESYALHVVCAWIGNSQPVAAKHYLQVTDDHFRKAVQEAVQCTPVSGSTGLDGIRQTPEKQAFSRPVKSNTVPYESTGPLPIPPRGIERDDVKAYRSSHLRISFLWDGANPGAVLANLAHTLGVRKVQVLLALANTLAPDERQELLSRLLRKIPYRDLDQRPTPPGNGDEDQGPP